MNLSRPDVKTLEKVLKTPEEKFMDKVLKSVSERSTSIEEETGIKVTKDQVKEAYISSLEDVLGIEVYPGETTREEEETIRRQWEIISSDEWIFRRSSRRRFSHIPPGTRFCRKRYKALKLIAACVLTDERKVIKDIMIYGDFFARPIDFVDGLEKALIGISAIDLKMIESTVNDLFARPDFECAGINDREFAMPILEACKEIASSK